MFNALLVLITTAQAAPVPQPAPPAREIYTNLVSRENYRRRLLHDCMSPSGATLVADDWVHDRWLNSPDAQRRRAMQRELADAAATEPLDLARLEQAIMEEAREDARRATARAERKIALLRSLSLADQAILARRFGYLPKKPGPSCELPTGADAVDRDPPKDTAH